MVDLIRRVTLDQFIPFNHFFILFLPFFYYKFVEFDFFDDFFGYITPINEISPIIQRLT